MSQEYKFIPVEELADTVEDSSFWERVVVSEISARGGKKSPAWSGADIKYVRDEDDINSERRTLIPIIMGFPPQYTYGISGVWPLGTKDDTKTFKSAVGYQLRYPLTSRDTVAEPTREEKAVKFVLDKLRSLACESFERDMKNGCKIPSACKGLWGLALNTGNLEEVVKPLYDMQKSTDDSGKKFPDPTKQLVSYIKLRYYHNQDDKTTTCHTPIYGPGDVKVNVEKYFSIYGDGKRVSGMAEPAIRIEGLYYGAHGDSVRAVSVRLRVIDLNYTPSSAASDMRFLGPNNAPKEDEYNSDSESEHEEEKKESTDDNHDENYHSPHVKTQADRIEEQASVNQKSMQEMEEEKKDILKQKRAGVGEKKPIRKQIRKKKKSE